METPDDVAKQFDERHHLRACVSALATLQDAADSDHHLAYRLATFFHNTALGLDHVPMNDLAELFKKE